MVEKGGVWIEREFEMGGLNMYPIRFLHFFASLLHLLFFFFFSRSVDVRFTSDLDGWVACHDIA